MATKWITENTGGDVWVAMAHSGDGLRTIIDARQEGNGVGFYVAGNIDPVLHMNIPETNYMTRLQARMFSSLVAKFLESGELPK
jgi:hypothetical protein